MKTALIIGITGQDGSYLAELLLNKGYSIIGISRNCSIPNLKNLYFLNIYEAVKIIEVPNFDSEVALTLIRKYKPDEIYNLSAQSSVGYSFLDPFSTLQYNINSVLYWLEAIKKENRPIKFYQASSSEMFGNVSQLNLPLTESLLFHPASPYGVSKAAAHWLTVNYRESHKLFASCGILFNHESCLRGPNFVLKKILNAAVKIKLGLQDEKIKVGNLNIFRDFGYAPNYVEAMWKIMQYEKAEDFLICSGTAVELKVIVQEIFTQLELPFEKYISVDNSLFRPVDLKIIYGDNTKSKMLLKWDYQMSYQLLIEKLISDEFKYIAWENEWRKK